MKLVLTLAVTLALGGVLLADEGMWTFDNIPKDAIARKYKVTLTDQWLQRLQQSVVRLESGCTGSFVSAEGLILTNHHCAAECLSDLSTAQRDYIAQGFSAATRDAEVRCPGEQISVLMAMQNVTPQVTKAIASVPAAQTVAARNRILTELESECEAASQKSGTPLSCEAVTLYQGGQYWIYKYKRYDDVRIVFAPEAAVAAFGGDPDNFQFPRWCLDMSLLRAYDNGKPAAVPAHLTIAWSGAAAGDPVFVAGHPGTTQRLMTVAQLKTQRDVFLPFWLLRFSELRGRLIQYSKTSAEAQRTAKDYLDSIENSHKVRRMQLTSLLDDRMMDQRIADERELRAAVQRASKGSAKASDPWDEIARAEQRERDILIPYTWLEGGAGFNSQLFGYARLLVRAADERAKPNASRMREYTDAALPQLRAEIEAHTPIAAELEQVRLAFSLERMREYLGPDHAMIKSVLGNASPDERARQLVAGSTLADPAVRLKLYEGGQGAVSASTDPMIALARAVDTESRRLRTIYENEVEGPVRRAQQVIAEARFKAYGARLYPDATFTLRLTYGAVDGWAEAGARVEPFTRLDRMYERATGAPPFALPKGWLDAKPRLELSRRANFVATTDIVGGNSGSPVVNARGEIVGLVFDGNIHSISGSYWFDTERNRTVAVHPEYMRTALEQVYRVEAIAKELGIRN
ncbi:MAG TPA: S46 family peptidase [Vicinamibacterales bacterium]|nr:S46 family peptidase [Vicinamibacterales bacterium]